LKINFKELNENLSYQRVVLRRLKDLVGSEEFDDYISATRLLEEFNEDMMRIYEESEIDIK
jgi:hypothetical protein